MKMDSVAGMILPAVYFAYVSNEWVGLYLPFVVVIGALAVTSSFMIVDSPKLAYEK